MLAWDGEVMASAPAIYWALFGLCPVKPHSSFPQLRPILNFCRRDQSPEEHRDEEGNSNPITYTRRMCFFLHTFKDVKRNASAAHMASIKLFSSSSALSLSAVNQTVHMPYQNMHAIFVHFQQDSFIIISQSHQKVAHCIW